MYLFHQLLVYGCNTYAKDRDRLLQIPFQHAISSTTGSITLFHYSIRSRHSLRIQPHKSAAASRPRPAACLALIVGSGKASAAPPPPSMQRRARRKCGRSRWRGQAPSRLNGELLSAAWAAFAIAAHSPKGGCASPSRAWSARSAPRQAASAAPLPQGAHARAKWRPPSAASRSR